jgi:ADP-heptose:LPS heptosyltransferase
VHIVEIIDENPHNLAPGDYVAENVNAGEMLACGWAKVRAPSDVKEKLFDPAKNWNGRKILFVRPGGFGDLLFLTPTIAEIKRRWPDTMIYVACFDRFRPALHHNPDVTGFVPYPVPLGVWGDCDAHVWLENIFEANPKARTTHAVDLISERCGLELTDKKMRYFVSTEEMVASELEFPRTKAKRVGIQLGASGRCRIYPYTHWVAEMLWRECREVFLFGKPGELKTNGQNGIVNLTALNKTFRESCAILATCDVVVGPDSALVHVAGALDVPCVALYGPFPWQFRTAYATQTFALQGSCPVSPCFHHVRPGLGEFPEWGPCDKTGRCEALAGIPPERVVREVTKKLEVEGAKTI